jgi:hypothetical protein
VRLAVKDVTEEALRLITQAIGSAASVDRTGSDSFSLEIDGATTANLRLVPWQGSLMADDVPHAVWILRRPSQSELERLRDADQSFVALNGAVRLHVPRLLVDRTGLRPKATESSRVARSAFSDRASLVPRALFAAGPESEWTISGLAREARVSVSGASYALRDLEDRGVVELRRSGRRKWVRLLSRILLVEEWGREYHWRDNRALRVMAPMGSPERFYPRAAAALMGSRWAVTLQAGAALLSRHAPVEDLHLYVEASSDAELREVADRAGWEVGEDGPVQLVSSQYGSSLWQGVRNLEGVPVVSTLQLILDLWNHPIRGREQAERLLESLGTGRVDGDQ